MDKAKWGERWSSGVRDARRWISLPVFLFGYFVKYMIYFHVVQSVDHFLQISSSCYSLVTQLCLTLCDPMDCCMPDFPVLHYLPRVCSNSCPLSWWCYLTILSSASSFSFCLQSLPASGSFPMSQLFTSGGEVLELQQQSFHSIFKVDFLSDWLVWSPCSSRGSQESSLAL